MNKKIGIFDSGIGGITTYYEIRKLLPYESFIYYADNRNNPYGDKNKQELIKICDRIVRYLISKDVKMIIIACNTATTNCIKYLRETYPNIIFVGTEPAIKVACDKNYKNTLVMATPCTILSEKTQDLIAENKKEDQTIHLLGCDNLAYAIEKHNEELIDDLLREYLTGYENIDSVVLGCTHYPYIKDKIQKYFPNAEIIDGNVGVAKRVRQILEDKDLISNDMMNSIEFITSK